MPGRQNQTYDLANHYDLISTLAIAALGASNSQDQVNPTGSGLILGINVTTITGTAPTLVVTVQGKDEAGPGNYYTLLASAAIAANGFSTLTLYPGAVVTANVSANAILPNTWRCLYTAGGTAVTSIIGTIGASVCMM